MVEGTDNNDPAADNDTNQNENNNGSNSSYENVDLSGYTVNELFSQYVVQVPFLNSDEVRDFYARHAQRNSFETPEDQKLNKKIRAYNKNLSSIEKELESRGVNEDIIKALREKRNAGVREAEIREKDEKYEIMDQDERNEEDRKAAEKEYKELLDRIDESIQNLERFVAEYETSGPWTKAREFYQKIDAENAIAELRHARGNLISEEILYLQKKRDLEKNIRDGTGYDRPHDEEPDETEYGHSTNYALRSNNNASSEHAETGSTDNAQGQLEGDSVISGDQSVDETNNALRDQHQEIAKENLNLLESLHRSKKLLIFEDIIKTGHVTVGDEYINTNEINETSPIDDEYATVIDIVKNLRMNEGDLMGDPKDLEIKTLLPENSDEFSDRADEKVKKIQEKYEKKMQAFIRHIEILKDQLRDELKNPDGRNLERINYLSSLISETYAEAEEYQEWAEKKIVAFGIKNRFTKLFADGKKHGGKTTEFTEDVVSKKARSTADKIKGIPKALIPSDLIERFFNDL